MLVSLLLKHHLSGGKIFPNERLVSLLVCVFVWLSVVLGTPVSVIERDLDLKSWGVFIAWSDSSLLCIANSSKTRGHLYSENAICSAPPVAGICLLNKIPMTTIIHYKTLEKTHEDPVLALKALSDTRNSLDKIKLEWVGKSCVKVFTGFKIRKIWPCCCSPRTHQCPPCSSLTGQLVPWPTHLACAQSIWNCWPLFKLETLAASNRALKWIWQDPDLVVFHRNMTFVCCGLQAVLVWTEREERLCQ